MQKGFDDFLNHLGCQLFPLDFGNSVTTSEFLQELYSYIKKISEENKTFNDQIYADFNKKFNDLKDQLLNNDSYYNATIDKLRDFCTKYISDLIADSLKYITFELTDDGYFCANIPSEWVSEIEFDTNIDSESEDYGKLIIKY